MKKQKENKTKKLSFNKNNVINKKTSSIMTFFLALIILAAVFAALYAGSNLLVIKSAEEYTLTVDEAAALDADCILVLGCRAMGDEPSIMLEHRILTGIDLYNAGASKKLLMSGDHGRDEYNEVYAMKKYALSKGIVTDDIFCDHAGFSTYDSMYRAKEIFGCRKIIVVTQQFHLARAIYTGRQLGLEVYGVSCDRGSYDKARANAVRESLARPKAILDCIIKSKPKYLGEAIPISGKGSYTDDTSFGESK